MTTQLLIEPIDLTEAVINADTRTVRQRLIRVGQSLHGHTYTEESLRRAVNLFEGVKTYANHPLKSEIKDRGTRNLRELTGWIENVTFENDGLYGTRHFTENQAGEDIYKLVKQVVERTAPLTLVGCSINAFGKARRRDNETIVESIDIVSSVDDVDNPAAGGGFEPLVASNNYFNDVFQLLEYDEWLTIRPDFKERFLEDNKKVRWNAQTIAIRDERDKYKRQLQESQRQVKGTQERIVQLEADNARLAKQVHVIEALQAVSLPRKWKDDLKTQLSESDPKTWHVIIDREIAKAEAVGHRPTVPIAGAGQHTLAPLPVTPNDDVIIDWSEVKTPADFRRAIRQYEKVTNNVRNST